MRRGRFTVRFAMSLLLGTTALSPGMLAQPAVATPPAGLTLARPESVGLSPEALGKIDEGMQGLVDKQHLAGVVTLVARHGKVVQHKAYGVQDLESRAPMQLDTIARIYSMTKPVTGVAMMMLYEEGKWKPSDPIAKHIPEFANLKVYAGEIRRGADPRSARASADDGRADVAHGRLHVRPVRQYRGRQDVPGDKPLGAPSLPGVHPQDVHPPLAVSAWNALGLQRLGRHPGLLVEKLSGKTFPEFLRTRIFDPLGMKDTAFLVPAEKLPRVATIYAWSQAKGALSPMPRNPDISRLPGLPSGGGGLYRPPRTTSASRRCSSMAVNSAASGCSRRPPSR